MATHAGDDEPWMTDTYKRLSAIYRARWARLCDEADRHWKEMTGSIGPDIRWWNQAPEPAEPPSVFAIGAEADREAGRGIGIDARGDLEALRRKVMGRRDRRVDPAAQAGAKKRRALAVDDDASEDEGRAAMVGKRRKRAVAERPEAAVEKEEQDEWAGFSGEDEQAKSATPRTLADRVASAEPSTLKMKQTSGKTKSARVEDTERVHVNAHAYDLDQESDDQKRTRPLAASSRPGVNGVKAETETEADGEERKRLKKQRKREAKKRRKQDKTRKGD